MYLLIVFLALCFCQSVSSVPENDVPSANSTKVLFKRVDNPTYAIDGTCTGFPQVQDIVNDWFQTVQVTSHRINLGRADPHFQWAFQVLFNTDPNSNTLYNLQLVEDPITAYDFVEFVTSSLASLTPHADPDTKANLIFYCDDDAMNPTPYSNERWQLRPDIRGDPNPNSGRTLGINQEWFDQVNFITRGTSTKGCKDEANTRGEPTELETYNQPITPFLYGNRLPPVGVLQPTRSTITICDCVLVEDTPYYPTIASSLTATLNRPRRQSPLALYRPQYGMIVSAGLYHESTHWTDLELDDEILRDGSTAYGWSKIMQLSTFKRLTNADTYAYLGLLARYESLGWWLDPHQGRADLGVMVQAPAGWRPP